MRRFISSSGYTFYVEESPLYDDDDDIRLEFLSLQRQPYPCVRMILSKRPKYTSASLQTLNYYSSCSIKDKMLDNYQGTIIMLKTALSYLITRYPHISRVELQDETFINIPTRPLITARRLLLGDQGWYEEHVGARPTLNTSKLTKYLRQPITQKAVQDIVLKYKHSDDKTWWSPENTKRVADELNSAVFQQLLGTTWEIDSATIRGWNVAFDTDRTGGSQVERLARARVQHKRLQRVLQGADSGYVNCHQVLYALD